MAGHRNHHEHGDFSEVYPHVSAAELDQKRLVRKKLEARLERKHLQESIDELDGEFDWDELER